ncbi:hypothetical protein BG006_006376 [Podila minutissima]|uniref:Mediator of RNA polymerase II transcription subunit 1 n=1 Tax=Podila minutissima TaxID=64525 RepID=A0A9P5VLN7_9FUNG|nr:hypothetical protein BG006_006376 [Podila minutissima]
MPTTDASTVQEHLRELKTLVHDSLKQWNLSTDTTAATNLVGMSNPTRMANELHPLGPVQVGVLQKEYKEKIAAIRAICYSFAQGPLHQSLNGGDSSLAPAFRKYSTVLKDESQLEEGVTAVKASMKECQNTLRAASQDGSVKTDYLLGTVKEMATGLGLECYEETTNKPTVSPLPVSTLTIGGTVIVIDIEIESTGTLLKVKVDYSATIHQDERIERLLAHNLRCKCSKLIQVIPENKKEATLAHLPDCSRDFGTFYRNLKALATLDSFQKKYPNIDFFHNIRSIDVDLKELFRREMLITNKDLQKVFTQGHGIPFTHAELPGPSVAYWASKADLLDVSWEALTTAVEQGANEKVKVPFHRISITMEEAMASTSGYLPNTRSGFLLSEEETQTLNSVPYGTIMTDQGSVSATTILQHPLRWVVPNSEPSVEAAYVGILHPPVVVSEEVAKQLAALSNQAGLNATMGIHKDPGYLSLQEMLINQNIEQAQWEIVLDQGPNAIRQLFSFDRTKNEARLIHRIPFTHISQVYMCTKLLRQQLTFNTLFQSCFNETQLDGTTKRLASSILPGSDSSLEVSIVVHTPQPPRTLLASFLNPYTETNMILEIQIDAGTGQPSVQLTSNSTQNSYSSMGEDSTRQGMELQQDFQQPSSHASGQQEQFTIEAAKLTEVLRLCDSVPILVRWVLKKSLAWMKDRHYYQGRPSLSHSSSTMGSSVQAMRRASGINADEGGILKRTRV